MAGIRAQRKAQRPGQILEAAFEEFVQNGFAATRLEDVAARAQVTKGTVYFYFENKEQVFESVLREQATASLSRFWQEDPNWTDDLAADVAAYLRRLYRLITEDTCSREMLRLLIAEARRFPALVDRHFQDFMLPVIEQLRERLDRGLPEASAVRPELPTVMLAPVLAANVMTLLLDDRRPFDLDRLRETHIDLLVASLGAAAAPACEEAGPQTAPGNDDWGPWRAFPDPRRGEALVAPIGPGAFDLRLRDGGPVMLGTGRSVASRLASLLPAEITPEQRRSASRRRFLATHLGRLEYRTAACASLAEAEALAGAIDRRDYTFRT